MHEREKVAEAKFFRVHLGASVEDRPAFNHFLSAFLSAARSVLQYAHKEASSRPAGSRWYKDAVSQRPVVRFFKDKRDVSIHAEPVRPAATIHVAVTETLRLSDSLSVTVVHPDGTSETAVGDEPPMPSPAPSETKSDVSYTYTFPDWQGMEDVLVLCDLYVAELQAIVHDGCRDGFISG